MATNKPWDVLLVQETHFDSKEQEAYGKYAYKHGFRFFHLEAHCRNQNLSHGTGILAKKQFRVRKILQMDDPLGRAIGINCEGLNIVSCYMSPSGRSPDFVQQLLEWINLRSARVPWMIAGDFNLIPEENDLFQLLEQEGAQLRACVDTEGNLAPTRFRGNDVLTTGFLTDLICFPSQPFPKLTSLTTK